MRVEGKRRDDGLTAGGMAARVKFRREGGPHCLSGLLDSPQIATACDMSSKSYTRSLARLNFKLQASKSQQFLVLF